MSVCESQGKDRPEARECILTGNCTQEWKSRLQRRQDHRALLGRIREVGAVPSLRCSIGRTSVYGLLSHHYVLHGLDAIDHGLSQLLHGCGAGTEGASPSALLRLDL